MTGYQGPQDWTQTRPVTTAGAVSPDEHYVFNGYEWVLHRPATPPMPHHPATPPKKSRTALWVGLGVAVTAVVAAAAGALVMSPSFQEGFRTGYAATTGWTAAGLEDSISSNSTLLDSGSEIGVQAVECAESAAADWYVCSWRQQGDSVPYIHTVETSGTTWQSSEALFMGSVSDLTRADINALVVGTNDGWSAWPNSGTQSAPDSAPGLTAASGPDFSRHLYEVFWDDGVTVHTGPRRATDSVTWLPEGTVVHVVCRTRGDAAPTSTGKTTTWWDWIDAPVSGYITDARIDTGGYPPSVPTC